jgi:hypothetical protein
MKWNGFHLTGQDGAAFDLVDHLASLPNDQLPHKIDVQALVRRGVTMPIRLIILRKPPEAVEATRKTLHARANRKQNVLDPRTLSAAEFLILGYPHLILGTLCDDLSKVFLESFPSGSFRSRIPAFTVDSAEVAVWALVEAIRGPITIQRVMQVTGDVPYEDVQNHLAQPSASGR